MKLFSHDESLTGAGLPGLPRGPGGPFGPIGPLGPEKQIDDERTMAIKD
jgi:hypothetical protein